MTTNIASYIDHTLLKPDALPVEITTLCEEAIKYHFASVCINPSYVSIAARILKGTDVKVCTVIGFPLGTTLTAVKVNEAMNVLLAGARELDMVIHVGRLKAGDHCYVLQEIRELAVLAHQSDAILKVIIETALLSHHDKVAACRIAKRAGADFVKTSTGFSRGGATVDDVALMRKIVGKSMGVKASGGVRDLAGAEAMIVAGATRIGTSSGVAIVTEAKNRET